MGSSRADMGSSRADMNSTHGTESVLASAVTFLFVPGHQPDRFDKAAASGADVVVIDLQDAVPDQSKEEALRATHSWLSDGHHAVVRINDITTAQGAADCAALSGVPGLLAIMVPLVNEVADIERAVGVLGETPIIALVETAQGIANANAIAALSAVVRLAFGDLDLAADLGAEPSWDAMLAHRSAVVLASRLGGLTGPIDGVTPDVTDVTGCANAAAAGRAVGFAGKLVIHPRQVQPTAAAYAPSDQQLEWARRVIAAGTGAGAVAVDGVMVDAPVLKRAHALLARAGAHQSSATEES